jgi:uncharacterized protein (PEP-CTERM system associated)
MRAGAALTRWATAALAAAGLLAAAPALAQTAPPEPAPAGPSRTVAIQPYIEVNQVLNASLDDGDVLTYTALAAGVDGTVRTRRVQASISYRYERRIAWEDDLADTDVHSGIAQVRAELIPSTLQVSAGALATRVRGDSFGPFIGFDTIDDPSQSEVYSFYAGPDFSRRIGDLDVAASYRIGYVEVDNKLFAGLPRPAGVEILDRYDRSVNHSASASIGMGVGELPFGWTLGAGYVREDVDRLDSEFEAAYVRGDIVLPVSPTFALTAGVGYEDISSSQQDILRDAVGRPILTPGGRLIGDPSRPRLRAFDTDGVIYDAGFIHRPSRRTELQARFGRRYGGTLVIGSARHQLNRDYGVQAQVYSGIESFGRLTVANLAAVPIDFDLRRTPFSNGLIGGGCVFGNDPGTGACFDDAFQSIATSNFRNRGASILFSGGRGVWSFGAGAGYASRRYFNPLVEQAFAIRRQTDESFTLNAYANRQLSRDSGISFDGYATWFDNGLPGIEDSSSFGVSTTYYRSFLIERLRFQAAAGLFRTESGPFDDTVASALVGLRYTF